MSALLTLAGPWSPAAEHTPEQIRFFETHIRPAFIKYCYECHSAEEKTSRGGLLVDTRERLLQGGDSGPAIESGNPERSLLWEAITWFDEDLEMPPDEKMPAEVIAHFKTWLRMGAPDPRKRDIADFKTSISPKDIEEGR
ncbi:MAG: c-type cytochrome domain-containing protein, partial [Verrucomicrobiota bacterium]